MKIRTLSRSEIPYIWQINRSEVIKNVYYLRNGKLVLEPEYFNIRGWPKGDPEIYTQILLNSFDHGGHFWGAFAGELLIGTVVLESRFIGRTKSTLQIKFLYISSEFRKHRIGKKLFLIAAEKAVEMGAKKIYISAISSENTINFYTRLGCTPTSEIDANLFALEPENIHLEFDVDKIGELQK